MISKEVIVKSYTGLESRQAAMLIQKASNYKANIWIEKGDRKANAKSLLGLLSLSIENGARIVIIVDGEDEEKALQELEDYMSGGSGKSVV